MFFWLTTYLMGLFSLERAAAMKWAKRLILLMAFGVLLVSVFLFGYCKGTGGDPNENPKRTQVQDLFTKATVASNRAEVLEKSERVTDEEVRQANKIASKAQKEFINAVKSDIDEHTTFYSEAKAKYCAMPEHEEDCK